MLRCLGQAIGRGIVLYGADRTDIVVCKFAGEVGETIFIILDYFDWRMCDFTSILVFWKENIYLAEIIMVM